MFFRFLSLVLVSSAVIGYGQTAGKRPLKPSSVQKPADRAAVDDELKRHLSAARSYQSAGDLDRAAVENKAVISIASRRIGIAELEQGKYADASAHLLASAAMEDSSIARAGLAAAYLQMSRRDEALAEAQNAVRLDPKNSRARQILGTLYFSGENYEAAAPELEEVFRLTPDFDSAYLLGITYLRLKQLERAKLLFDEIQRTVKTRKADLHILFGQAFEQTEYAAEAEREFKTAIALEPRVAKAHFYLGFVILQHGGGERLPEAGKEFDAELKLTPLDFHANFFRGVVASSLNDHKQAVVYLQRAVRINPKSPEACLFLGQSQQELNDLAGAEKNLRLSLKLSDRSPRHVYQDRRTHFLLGRLLIRTGRKAEGDIELAKAREIQDQLLETDRQAIGKLLGQVVETESRNVRAKQIEGSAEVPMSATPKRQEAAKTAEFTRVKNQLAEILAEAYHNLGVIAVQQGNFDDAFEKFKAASEWKFDLPGLDRNSGIIAFRLAKYDAAIQPLTRHIKADPKDDLARRMLGVSYYLTRNYKQAALVLDPVNQTLFADPELAYFYGIALTQSDRHKEAASFFSKLIIEKANDPQARFYAAQGFVLLGDLEKALREYRSLSASDPQMPQVHYNAGQTLIRLNRFDEAEKEFREELVINPADASSKYHLAFTMIERKVKTDDAIALLNDAVALRPDYAEALYQLGKIYLEMGETEKAIDNLERAANSQKGKDYVHYQLSLAYRRASRVADADRQLKIYRDLREANRTPGPRPGN